LLSIAGGMKGSTTAEMIQDVATKRCIFVSGFGAREEKFWIEARKREAVAAMTDCCHDDKM
jgi:hypothetical protein